MNDDQQETVAPQLTTEHTKNNETDENFSFFVCFVYFRLFRSSSSALATSPPWLKMALPRRLQTVEKLFFERIVAAPMMDAYALAIERAHLDLTKTAICRIISRFVS
jgi:hypothetical protein